MDFGSQFGSVWLSLEQATCFSLFVSTGHVSLMNLGLSILQSPFIRLLQLYLFASAIFHLLAVCDANVVNLGIIVSFSSFVWKVKCVILRALLKALQSCIHASF